MSLNQSVLICDQVNPILKEILEKNGLKVTYEPGITPEQLAEKIGNYEVIVVRSRTKIVKELVEKAGKCQIIARVGVGLDNIDQDASKAKKELNWRYEMSFFEVLDIIIAESLKSHT